MKKKEYKIVIIIVIIFILLISFCVYELFKNKTRSIKSLDNASYAMVKTHNIDTRTQVSFPVLNNLVLNEAESNDFEKTYNSDNDSKLYVIFHKIEGTPSDEFVTYKYDTFKLSYDDDKYLVNSSNINCKETCKRYQVFQDNKIYLDVIKVFIEFSKEDIFELSYEQKNETISNDVIDTIVDNIYISNDAIYLQGESDDEYLRITLDLLKGSRLHLSFNSNLYEEVEDGENNNHLTNIRNIKTKSLTKLRILFNYPNKSILDTIDTYYKTNNRKIIKVLDKLGYEYSLDNGKAYAIIIDDNSAILFEGSMNFNDIHRMFIEKDDNE